MRRSLRPLADDERDAAPALSHMNMATTRGSRKGATRRWWWWFRRVLDVIRVCPSTTTDAASYGPYPCGLPPCVQAPKTSPGLSP